MWTSVPNSVSNCAAIPIRLEIREDAPSAEFIFLIKITYKIHEYGRHF